MAMWLGAKISDESVSRMEWLMTPLNRNRMAGRIDSDNARNIPGLLKHTIQMTQYASASSASLSLIHI